MGQQERYPIRVGGSEIIPTTAGTYYTDDQSASTCNNAQVYVEFFSDAAGTTPVTPTGGTITLAAAPFNWFSANPANNTFLAPPSNATITATNVIFGAGPATYSPPVFVGRVALGRAILAGITGAAYCRITFWRYGV